MTSGAAAQSDGRGLKRDLRRWDLVALVINSVIGAGIFGLPSRVFALAGTYSLFAHLVSAVAIGLIVMCFAEVTSRFNGSGGPYLYTRAAFGPVIGFQVGWLMWLARVTSYAALCNLLITYLGYFVSPAAAETWRIPVIAALAIFLTATNIIGVRTSALVSNTLTVGKLIPLCVVAIVGLFVVDSARYTFSSPPSYGGFSQAALLLIFAYGGFEAALLPAGEARDPERHFPFALPVGLVVVAFVYISIQTVCIGTFPGLAASERPLLEVGRILFGPPGAVFVTIGALISITGTLNVIMFGTPRLLFAMAEHGQLPAVLLTTHPRFRTPVVAIVVNGGVALALTLSTSFLSALTISTIIRLLTYAATCAAVPALRRTTRPVAAPRFLLPGGPAVAGVAVLLSAWLLSGSAWNDVRLVLLAIAAGFLVYLPAWSRRKAPKLVQD